MGKVIYTYWRHYTRYSEEEDSLVDALERADYAEDSGDASVESITTARGKVIGHDEMARYWKRHKELEKRGAKRENERVMHLRFVTDRSITWQEASTIIRRMRWTPVIARQRGIALLIANKWGKEQRIVSVAKLRTMTPSQFWQRLRHLDPYRVAEVERGTF